MRLTGLVIAQDEARDLPACLAALAFCDERLVIDGGSRDDTIALAAAAGARVVSNPWPGYAAQRRFGLAQAQGEWVLAVDADEQVDARLREAVLRAVAAGGEAAGPAGHRIRVQNWFLGRRLRFGGVGHDDHLRLVRRAQATVVERRVHEGFAVPGPIGQLPGALLHRSYADLSEAVRKLDAYATLGAAEAHAAGRRMSRLVAALRLPFGFWRRYLLLLGFLDGYPGFVHAALQAQGDFLKGAKLRERFDASAGGRPG